MCWQAEELITSSLASGLKRLLRAGGVTGPEEDVACGDRCLRSPNLADRQAGLGQKLYVLKLFLNQKPQDSAFLVVNV